MIVLARDSAPAALLGARAARPYLSAMSGAARLIGAAIQELYAQADDLTVSEAEAAIEASWR